MPRLDDPVWRLTNLYLIKTKQAQVRRLKLNRIQSILLRRIESDLIAGRPVIDNVLKFRQGGVSTFYLLLHLDRTAFHLNINTGILADLKENLGYLFEMVRFAHESMPDELRPNLGSDSKSELTFPELNSKIFVSLAIKSTTLHGLHISEYAHMDQEDVQRTIGACAPGAWITTETTANGMNFYRDKWLGESKKIFLPWPLQGEYRLPADGVQVVRNHEEERLAEAMLRKHALVMDDEQMLFRRKAKKDLGRLFLQEMAEDEETCFLSTGGAYFDGAKIQVLLSEAEQHAEQHPPIKQTDELTVWERPDHGHTYIAGADVAEGVDGDYSVLAILCTTCRKTAARYRARCGVDSFYRTCAKFGQEYFNARLAVERNNHGHAVILGLREMGYKNLYVQRPSAKIITREIKKDLKFGWDTTSNTKPVMLDALKMALEGDSDEDADNFEPALTWLDTEFLKETLDVREEGGKISAVAGKHDDMVIAYAIAYQLFRAAASRPSLLDPSRVIAGDKMESV